MTHPRRFVPSQIASICFLLLLTIYSAAGQISPSWNWVQPISGPGLGRGLLTVSNATGDVYQTGSFTRTVQLGATTLTTPAEDMYLVKYNRQGVVQWARQSRVPNASGPSAQGVCITTDLTGNIYVAGTFVGTLTLGTVSLTAQTGVSNTFVVKYNDQGVVLWAIASSSNSVNRTDVAAIVAMTNGDVFVSGFFTGSTTFGNLSAVGHGDTDAFLLKLNITGAAQWIVSAGGTGPDYATALAPGLNGGVYLGGRMSATATFGTLTAISQGGTDAFLVEYDAQGVAQWVERYGGSGNEGTGALVTSPTGEIYDVGFFQSSADFGTSTLVSQGDNDGYVMKCTSQGTPLWASRLGGTGIDGAYSVTINAGGALYVAGYFSTTADFGVQTRTSAGGTDIFVARYTTTGTPMWVEQCGGLGSEISAGVANGMNGTIYLGGRFGGTAQFGPISMNSQGSSSGFVASLFDSIPTPIQSPSILVQCRIYPNPIVGNTLNFELSAILHESATITIRDITGKKMRQMELQPNAITGTLIQLDISLLMPGRYLLQFATVDNVVVKGFCVQ